MTNLHFLLTIVLALFGAIGCKTTESSTFQVVCRFEPELRIRTLVVTNPQGEELAAFQVPSGSTELSEQLENAPDDRLDYHLIDTVTWNAGPQITTWRSVPNGGSKVFLTRTFYPQLFPASKILFLKVVGATQTVAFTLPCLYGNLLGPNDSCNGFGPGVAENTCSVSVYEGEDLCVQFQQAGDPAQKIGIFNTSSLQEGDTLVVDWQELAQETYFEISCPDGLLPVSNASVKVFNTPETRGTMLRAQFETGTLPNRLKIAVPVGFPLQEYYVQVSGSWATTPTLDNRVSLAQTFAPGTPLKLEMPVDLAFQTVNLQPNQINLSTASPDFDLMEVRVNYDFSSLDQGRFTDWVIYSGPGAVPYYTLPNLSTHWPTRLPLPAQPDYYECSLLRLGQHTSTEVRAGFPFRSSPIGVAWPVAVSGLQKVSFKQE